MKISFLHCIYSKVRTDSNCPMLWWATRRVTILDQIKTKQFLFLLLAKHVAIKTYGGVDVYLYLFFNLRAKRNWEVSFTFPSFIVGETSALPICWKVERAPESILSWSYLESEINSWEVSRVNGRTSGQLPPNAMNFYMNRTHTRVLR
jgi:hypothetical protein